MNIWNDIKSYMAGYGKPFDYVVLCVVVGVYLYMRARELPSPERIMSPITSISFAWVFSDWLAETISIPEKGAALIIMVFGVVALNMALSFVDDPAFVRGVVKAWVLKRAGIEKEDLKDG